MKKIAIIAILAITFASCNQKSTATSTKESKIEKVKYACPMHPEVTGNQGEKCSKCGMDLKEVKS